MTQQHKLDATVFVYRHKRTGKIQAHYIDIAKLIEDDNEWEHLASLEPRMWIECNYSNADRLEQAEKLIDELEKACLYYCNPDDKWSPRVEHDKIVKALASAKAWKDGT